METAPMAALLLVLKGLLLVGGLDRMETSIPIDLSFCGSCLLLVGGTRSYGNECGWEAIGAVQECLPLVGGLDRMETLKYSNN